jgi:predicted RNase H-like HicB family nuclease
MTPVDNGSQLPCLDRLTKSGLVTIPGKPAMPGCVALGDTIEDAERQMREAIAFPLEGLRDQGEPVPPPSAVAAVMVTTPAA